MTAAALPPGLSPMERAAYRQFVGWCEQRGVAPADATPEQWDAFDGFLIARYTPDTATHYRSSARRAARRLIPAPANGPAAAAPPSAIDPRLAELWDAIREMEYWQGWGPEDEEFRAMLVMLSPVALHTMDPAAIAAAAGFSVDEVGGFVAALQQNGIWTAEEKICGSWDEPEAGGLALLMDAWVATGMLVRAPAAGPEGEGAERPEPETGDAPAGDGPAPLPAAEGAT